MAGVLTSEQEAHARSLITSHPNFPKPGITFLSLFPALADAVCLRNLVGALSTRYGTRAARDSSTFFIAGVDARGFTLVPYITSPSFHRVCGL